MPIQLSFFSIPIFDKKTKMAYLTTLKLDDKLVFAKFAIMILLKFRNTLSSFISTFF